MVLCSRWRNVFPCGSVRIHKNFWQMLDMYKRLRNELSVRRIGQGKTGKRKSGSC